MSDRRVSPAPGRDLLLVAFTLFALVGAIPGFAHACGQCVEDKVAATYDDAVRTHAARVGHVVVFTEVRGPAAGAPPALRDLILHALATTPGVDPGTVRVSLEPPAAAFACDPRRHPPSTLISVANARLAGRRLSLGLIKVDEGVRPTLGVPAHPSSNTSGVAKSLPTGTPL